MSFKQLEYFICLAETLNFTQAAKRCFISQAAMTMQIKALEEYLGVVLLVRDKHHVELTAAGKIYLEEARSILAKAEEAKAMLQHATEGIVGNLSIGFARGYEQSSFTETIKDFRASQPNINLKFVRDNMSPLYDRLLNKECDVLFNLMPISKEHEGICHREIMRTPIYAILYTGHPLAEKSFLKYSDLNNSKLIITQPEGRSYDEAEEVLLFRNKGGFYPKSVIYEPEPEMVLFKVSVGMGVAILPEYVVRYIKGAPNLRYKALITEEGAAETLGFGLSWLEDIQNPALETFLHWAEKRNIRE